MSAHNSLNLKELNKIEDICIREAPPACTSKCPAHVDARGIATAIKKGDFAGAYKLFSAAVPFTRIISETCARVCESACKRMDLGGSVQIGALEQASVDYGYKKSILNKAFLPKKAEKVAVIGGGLSGLSAAYYLRRKGFKVDIYEKSGKLGGKLNDIMPPEIIDVDISVIFELGVNVIYNKEITVISEIEKCYDAVYIAIGGNTFNYDIDSQTLYVKDNLFAGGSMRIGKYSSIFSLSDGKRAATSIERHVQKASMTAGRENECSRDTSPYTNVEGIAPEKPVSAECTRYTKDEAIEESARCIDCRCNECEKGCEFLTHYQTNPKKLIREIRNCLQISVGNRFANEAINSCSECGFCSAVCPVGLYTGGVCRDAKIKMVETDKMPPSAHDFALNDMAHSNGGDCFIARHQRDYNNSKYVFFPGCQLGATAPVIVKKTYADLCGRLDGGVGLILGCCGAIADWAAREKAFMEALDKLRGVWEDMGKPKIITACPTCYKIFTEKIPDMKVTGIWAVLEEIGLPPMERKPLILAVHDACTTRGHEEIHSSIRRLLDKMGVTKEEPHYSQGATQCCGYGGLTGFTNRVLSDKTAAARAMQSQSDYVTYCINCRDRFIDNGKKAYHLLEIVYGTCDNKIEKFGWSERRFNREKLKQELLKSVWGEQMEDKTYIEIRLDKSVSELIEKRMILFSDIRSVIEKAESTGKKLKDSETGAFISSKRLGFVTFWVWYTKSADGYVVHKAYSHRMTIEGM